MRLHIAATKNISTKGVMHVQMQLYTIVNQSFSVLGYVRRDLVRNGTDGIFGMAWVLRLLRVHGPRTSVLHHHGAGSPHLRPLDRGAPPERLVADLRASVASEV